ncbi:hypothetical protein [Ramlibacter sp. WS9]|uniref:hypothetical protein n=1 Tax=Ramlibacter sp. WS9 TaxID=1882741 RepID=UPI0011416397|nr:hypothetical protein [Ramlibacter sp. WS9]ROZ76538.1 hypothetical protein EEB15_11835 [Ramlibacter sp. WS9]
MRIAIPCVLLALLGGCAVVPHSAWTFDPTRPQPKPALAVADAAGLTDRMAQLQLERNEIRARIASEPSAVARLRLYEDLHGVGMQLSPLERRLATFASSR